MIARDPATVFAWVADYRNVPAVLEGVERWEPLGRRTTGEGARFAVTMRVFGQELEDVLVLDTWDEPRAIGWRSASHGGDWRFRPLRGGTEVTLTISYRVPGGVLGGLVAGPLVGALRTRLEQALDRMRATLEATRAR